MTGPADNAFTAQVLAGVAEQDALRDTTLEPGERSWRHRPAPERVSPPAMLQGRTLVAEVTDHGALLLPFSSRTRAALDVVGYQSGEGREFWIRPQAAERRGGDGHTVWTVHPEEPVLVIEFVGAPGPVSLRFATGTTIEAVQGGLWLETPDHPLVRPDLAHNNSRVPDPIQPNARRDGVFVAALNSAGTLLPTEVGWVAAEKGEPLVDRGVSTSRATVLPLSGRIDRLLLAVVAAPAQGREAAERVRKDDATPVRAPLRIEPPDGDMTRQLAFAVANSLAARAHTSEGDIFVHGRRDRGYADVGHLHQSYAMHLPALAAGEVRSVREDLLAYLRLQDPDGGIRRAPRPGPGSHAYVGTYTNGHVPLALERYLAWTDDRSILAESVNGETVLSRSRRAMEWLRMTSSPEGLVAPCGWLDAWNPDVVAQGQTSAVAVLGWRAIARVLAWAGEAGADEALAHADSLVDTIRRQLLSSDSGIVAENLMADGRVEGGASDDFFAHTQLWAALADITGDSCGLDLVAQRCWGTGVKVVPESALERGYFADSTDGADSLGLDSTATWLLASWPELTHLFALELARRGDGDLALDAVLRQMPTTLHRSNADALPYYYAEKYLHPGDRPWLCTWAGDPTLVEVVLHGFFGVRVGLGTVQIVPSWPSSWVGQAGTVDFLLRGDHWRIVADPSLPRGAFEVDGQEHAGGQLTVARGRAHVVRFGVAGPDS